MTYDFTYARAGNKEVAGFPEKPKEDSDWRELAVLNAAGVQLTHVIEVNTVEGWCVRYQTTENAKLVIQGDEALTERLEGEFRIVLNNNNSVASE